jgi:hypothetical protein
MVETACENNYERIDSDSNTIEIIVEKGKKKVFMFNDQLLFLHLYGNQTIISSSHTILFKLVIFVTV